METTLVRGIRLNNPGNLRRSSDPWQGLSSTQADPEFLTFKSPEWGIRALARTLITYQDKRRAADGSAIDTVRELVTRWAPPRGHSPAKGGYSQDTASYVADVARRIGVGPDDVIDLHGYAVMRPLVEAIIAHECANYRYPAAVIDEGLRLAGIAPPARVDPVATTTAVASVSTGAVALAELGDGVAQVKDSLAPLAGGSGLVSIAVVALSIAAAGVALYLAWRRYARARGLSA